MTKLLMTLAALGLLLPVAASGQEVRAPVVLYTDLLSGPNRGGENDNGAYLSIFGKNFGDPSGLGSTTKVFIGGVEVAGYLYLGPSQGRHDVEQITVQVGHLGNSAAGAALAIEVRVGDRRSSSFTPQTFLVNPGRILFVSLTGDDATAVAGDIAHPWRHVQTSAGALTGVWGAARPGDVVVLRGGTWTDIGFGNPGRQYFVKFFSNSGTGATGAEGSGPISFTAYPGEKVVIHPPGKEVFGVIDGLNSGQAFDAAGKPRYSQWITISNLVITTGGINDGPVNLESRSNHWRVVNNDLSAPDAVGNRAAGVTGNGNHEAVLGNHIHDIAGVGSRGETLLDHGIYIDSGSDWELAYNLIERITGGSGIQLYNSGHVTPTIDNVSIHHNLVHDVAKHGLNIGDTSGAGILIWSNVVYNTAAGCWRNNSVNLQNAKVWNNTFYNCNTWGNDAAIWNDVKNAARPIRVDFRNNIICASAASAKYTGGEAGFTAAGVSTSGGNNLWCGGKGSASVRFDSNSVFADPKFVAADSKMPDFHLQNGSPARASGDKVVKSMVISNYDFECVAPGLAVDRGAY